MKKLSAVALAFLLSGCGTYYTSDVAPVTGGTSSEVVKKTPHRSVRDIPVTEEDSQRSYLALGDISVTVRKVSLFDKDPTKQKVNEALQEEAYQLGADEVILARYGTVGLSAWSYGALEGKGRAIAYQE